MFSIVFKKKISLKIIVVFFNILIILFINVYDSELKV